LLPGMNEKSIRDGSTMKTASLAKTTSATKLAAADTIRRPLVEADSSNGSIRRP